MLNLHPHENKQNETLGKNRIKCKQKKKKEYFRLGAKLDLYIKLISQGPAVMKVFRFCTNEYPPLATRDGFSHGQSQTEW